MDLCLISSLDYKSHIYWEKLWEEVHTLAGLVESGLGVSLIPSIKGIEQYEMQKIPVDAENCKRSIGMAYLHNAKKSPATEQFISFVRAYFE